MDVDSQKVTNIVKGIHDCSVKNAAVDPYFECLASTGCDGSLHVCSIKDLNNTSIIKKLKVSKTSVTPESPQMLGLAWSPHDGSYLYAAGDKQLSLLKRADGFSQSFSSNIVHDREITIVHALSTNCLLTAGLDKRIKIWQTQKTDLSDATLEHTIEVSQPITTLKYSAKNQAIAFMDKECSLGIVHFDLASVGKL